MDKFPSLADLILSSLLGIMLPIVPGLQSRAIFRIMSR